MEALVTAPLFSPEHKLVLPEGTKLTGEVVLAKKARSFHRAGQLRFNFQKVDLPRAGREFAAGCAGDRPHEDASDLGSGGRKRQSADPGGFGRRGQSKGIEDPLHRTSDFS